MEHDGEWVWNDHPWEDEGLHEYVRASGAAAPPQELYSVRECRGHWHITTASGEDIINEWGDALDEETARRGAATLNAREAASADHWRARAERAEAELAERAAAPPAGTQPYCEKCGGPCFACTKPGALATVPAGPGEPVASEVTLPWDTWTALCADNTRLKAAAREVVSAYVTGGLSGAIANLRAALAGAASPSQKGQSDG